MSEHNFLNQTSNFEINPPIAKDLLQQDFQSFNTTRQKGSSFHTKKDFKFKGNVNFQYNMPEIERVRFKSNNSRNKEDKENVLSGRKKIEGSNNSDQDDSMSVFSIDTESEFKLRKMSAKSIPKLSLKKSISIPRTSITSIFSGNKKKVNLQLSNQEDFKV